MSARNFPQTQIRPAFQLSGTVNETFEYDAASHLPNEISARTTWILDGDGIEIPCGETWNVLTNVQVRKHLLTASYKWA